MKRMILFCFGALALGVAFSPVTTPSSLTAQDVIQPPPWCPNTSRTPCAYTTVKVCIERGYKLKVFPWGLEFERPCLSWREQQFTFYYGFTGGEEDPGILYPV